MIPPKLKFAAVLVIWMTNLLILLALLAKPGDFNWIFGTVVVGVATVLTIVIFESSKEEHAKAIAASQNTQSNIRESKAKRGESNLTEMMSLLDEDDLYEVRQRIKQRMFDQIDGGSVDEVESFEHLLSTKDRQRGK